MKSLFEDFTGKLCNQENLIDVGPYGIATQSSTSKWSKENDAQRAVMGLSKVDYAFHTGKDDKPWWQLTFDQAVPISYIILNNRRADRFHYIADKLRISLQLDEDVWHEVFRGDVMFGAEPASMPLIVPLKGKLTGRAVRITLEKNAYLHLSGVHILVEEAFTSEKTKVPVFICNRKDGFGERLRALLNVMVCAEYYEGKFLVHWRRRGRETSEFHSVLPAEEMFAQSFIEQHFISKSALSRLKIVSIKDAKPEMGPQTDQQYDAALVEQYDLSDQFPELAVKLDSKAFLRAFNAVQFHPHFEAARTAAHAVELKGKPVAIHLRAGDIVYGRFRHSDRFTRKVTPFPVAEKLIKQAKADGNEVIIFGQDPQLCSYFSEKYKAIFADKLGTALNFDHSQKALFEICLMTRCREIYAGNSGFAVVAGLISGVTAKPADKLMSKSAIASLILKAVTSDRDSRISEKQVAFACLYAIAHYRSILPNKSIGKLADIGTANDPDNPFLAFQKIHHLYREKRFHIAENALFEEAEKRSRWDFRYIFAERDTSGKVPAKNYMPEFVAAAEAGQPMAALCVAAERQSAGDLKEALRYFDIYQKFAQRRSTMETLIS